MKTCLAILATLSVAFIPTAQAQTELPGKLVQQIPLAVEGWMDHIGYPQLNHLKTLAFQEAKNAIL
jgi:hypothetical protein